MPFTKNYRAPALLTGDARGAVRAFTESFLVNSYLPTRTNDTLSYDFNIGQTKLPASASFRSFNTQSEIGYTTGGESRSGKLPPISIRLHVDEYSQLVLYRSGDAAIAAKFTEYAVQNAIAIATRAILAGAEAIEYGRVTIAERGVQMAVDYGRRAELTATAGTLWGAGGSSPLDDLEALRAVWNRQGTMVTSPEVIHALQKNEEIISTAVGRGSDLPSRASVTDVLSVLGDYGFGQVTINSDLVTGRDGVERRVFSPNKVLFLPTLGGNGITNPTGQPSGSAAGVNPLLGGQLGTTDWGTTAEAIETENGISGASRAGVFAGAMASSDPSGYDVLASAIVLPVVTNTNASASLTVL